MPILVVLLPILLSGIHPPGGAPSTPTAVEITSVVTDRSGRPVPGLGPRDFELIEDGLPRPIERVDVQKEGSLYVLLLDELHVARAGTETVRAALRRFLEEQLTPADRVLVFRPLDSLLTVAFPEERSAAHAAVQAFDGRGDDLTPRTAFEAQVIGSSPAVVRRTRARLVTVALGELAARAGAATDGVGAIILVSDGFVSEAAELRAAIRAATIADVPIYSLSPDAQSGIERSAEDRATLQRLAEETGGEFLSGALDDHLARIARQRRGAYRLVYRPAAADGRYRPIQVRTTRPGVLVRARPGYWALPERPSLPERPATAPAAPARVLRRSPLIRSWVGVRPGDEGRVRVAVSWESAARTLPPARRPAYVALSAALAGGSSLYEARIAPVGDLAGDTPAVAVFEAPPGRLELDLVVHAADGTVLDRDSRDLEAASGAGRVRLYPAEIVRARSARELRQVLADPDAAPSPAREFRRTERLLVRVPARDAEGAPLAVRARLVNVVGQVLADLPGVRFDASADVSQFELTLAPFAPGEYALELTAGNLVERVRFRLTH